MNCKWRQMALMGVAKRNEKQAEIDDLIDEVCQLQAQVTDLLRLNVDLNDKLADLRLELAGESA